MGFKSYHPTQICIAKQCKSVFVLYNVLVHCTIQCLSFIQDKEYHTLSCYSQDKV